MFLEFLFLKGSAAEGARLAGWATVRKRAQDRDRKESGGTVCPKIGSALIGEEFRALLLLALEIERMGEGINAISC